MKSQNKHMYVIAAIAIISPFALRFLLADFASMTYIAGALFAFGWFLAVYTYVSDTSTAYKNLTGLRTYLIILPITILLAATTEFIWRLL